MIKFLFTILLLKVILASNLYAQPKDFFLEKNNFSLHAIYTQPTLNVIVNYNKINLLSGKYITDLMGDLKGEIRDFNRDGYLDFILKLPDEHGYEVFFMLNSRNETLRNGFCDGEPYSFDTNLYGIEMVKNNLNLPEYKLSIEDGAQSIWFHNLSKYNATYLGPKFKYSHSKGCFDLVSQDSFRIHKYYTSKQNEEHPWWKFWK